MIRHFPRLTTIALSYCAALLVFALLGPNFLGGFLTPLGTLGIFIAGMFYTYSFTASLGAVLLLPFVLHYPPGYIAVIGGAGSLVADLTIFRLIRNDLHKEVSRISSSRFIKRLGATPLVRENWFRDLVGALVIASPIPDEIGIAIMASAKIGTAQFLLLTFIADVVGIYALTSVASLIF